MGAIPETMFSSRGLSAWHDVGTIFPASVSYAQALHASGADAVNAVKLPLHLPNGKPVPNAHAIVDRDSGTIFSKRAVTDAFELLQHREIFEALRPHIEAAKLTPETGGVMFDRAMAWIACGFAGNVASVGGGDEVHGYAILTNDHRGTASVTGMISVTRPVCENTLALAAGEARADGVIMRVPHTKSVRDGLKVLADAIAQGREAFRATAEQYRYLAHKPVARMSDLATLAAATYGEPEIKAQAADKASPRMLDLLERFESNRFATAASRGTWWGAYNAITERQRHHGKRTTEQRLDSQTDKEQNARALLASIGLARGDSRETILVSAGVAAR